VFCLGDGGWSQPLVTHLAAVWSSSPLVSVNTGDVCVCVWTTCPQSRRMTSRSRLRLFIHYEFMPHFVNKSTRRAQTSDKAGPVESAIRIQVRIRDTSKIYWRFPCPELRFWQNTHEHPISFSKVWAKVWKNALSFNVEESFLGPDPDADDFHNLLSSALSTNTSAIKDCCWTMVL